MKESDWYKDRSVLKFTDFIRLSDTGIEGFKNLKKNQIKKALDLIKSNHNYKDTK